MTVADIMTRDVVTVKPDTSVEIIERLFNQQQFHHLVVLEGRVVTGVISDRDMLRTISPFLSTMSERAMDVKTLSRRAHQIMSREPITTEADAPVIEAMNLMLDQQINCLPVVDEKDRLVGIVTMKDIVRKTIGPYLEAVSEGD